MDYSEMFCGYQCVRYRVGRSHLGLHRRPRSTTGTGSVSSRRQSDSWSLEEPHIPVQTNSSLSAWGYVYQLGIQSVAVGAPIRFSNNGPLNGINHTPGTDAVEVTMDGTYNVFFSIYTAQNNPQDWGVTVNGVVQSRFNSSGQSISAATSLALNVGDRVTIRNVATLPDPANLRSGDFTSAWVLINKVD